METQGNKRRIEDFTPPEFTARYSVQVYDLVLKAATKTIAAEGVQALQKPEPESYSLGNVRLENREFAISIMRASVFGFLLEGVGYFERTEQYEKCDRCQRLLMLLYK